VDFFKPVQRTKISQINKSTNQQINKSTNQQINKSTNQQINKSTYQKKSYRKKHPESFYTDGNRKRSYSSSIVRICRYSHTRLSASG